MTDTNERLKIIGCQVPEILADELKRVAVREDRTVSYVLRRIVRTFVEQNREKEQPK